MSNTVVVITGSTRGIGRGLAEAFLERGCSVVIVGRTSAAVTTAVEEFSVRYNASKVSGAVCDVADFGGLQAIWTHAVQRFGRVDIWVNNAGIGQPRAMLWTLDAALIGSLADTNYKGVLLGCKVAIAGMLAQPGGGAIYNMEGMGSNGMKLKGMTLYGSSKRALSYITDSLALELKGTKVIIGGIQPGMVATDLVIRHYIGRPEEWRKVKKIFNILSDRIETVTPWLAGKMLANRKNGARFKWFAWWKAAWRFSTAAFLPRRIFPDMG
jgi:NAD(P)-dependent dehydrogenase (short-subunit alcohol dehydrogenase family)